MALEIILNDGLHVDLVISLHRPVLTAFRSKWINVIKGWNYFYPSVRILLRTLGEEKIKSNFGSTFKRKCEWNITAVWYGLGYWDRLDLDIFQIVCLTGPEDTWCVTMKEQESDWSWGHLVCYYEGPGVWLVLRTPGVLLWRTRRKVPPPRHWRVETRRIWPSPSTHTKSSHSSPPPYYSANQSIKISSNATVEEISLP